MFITVECSSSIAQQAKSYIKDSSYIVIWNIYIIHLKITKKYTDSHGYFRLSDTK